MISVTFKGKQVLCDRLLFRESLDLYVSEIELTLLQHLGTVDAPLQVTVYGSTYNVYPVKIEFLNNKYVYTCYPIQYFIQVQKTYGAVNFQSTLNEAAAVWGVTLDITFKSASSLWVYPELGFHKLYEVIGDNARAINGGGVICTFRFSGRLTIFDLITILRQDPIPVTGDLVHSYDSIEWIVQNPGNVNLVSYSDSGAKLNEASTGFFGKFNVFDVLSSESEDTVLTKEYNAQCRRLLRSSKVSIVLQGLKKPYQLGSCVCYGNKKTRFVVNKYELVMNHDGSTYQTLELAGCTELLKP